MILLKMMKHNLTINKDSQGRVALALIQICVKGALVTGSFPAHL